MKLSRNHILLGILAAGFLVRLAFFISFLGTPERFYDDDSHGYVQIAENLRTGHGFSWDTQEPFKPNAFRTPGYPLFLLAHKLVFGSYESAIITQSFLVAAIALMMYRIAGRLRRPGSGIVAAGIFLFMPFSIMVSLRFLTQPLFTFVLLLAVCHWIKFLDMRTVRNLIAAGILIGVAALVRPIAVYGYLPFVISLVIAQYRLHLFSWKKTLGFCLLFMGLFFLTISPWLIRNHRTFSVLGLSSITPYQLYFYDAPSVYAEAHDISYSQAREILETGMQKYLPVKSFDQYFDFSSGPVLQQRALAVMFESPQTLFITRTVQFGKFFIRDGIRYWQDWFPGFSGIGQKIASGAERLLLIAITFGMIIAAWLIRKHSTADQVVALSLLLVIAYYAGLTGVMASAGLRFPVEPLIVLFSVIGLNTVKETIWLYVRSYRN